MEPIVISPETRLLKANDARGLGAKVVFNFEDLRQRGEAYLESVRQQARELLETVQAEVETIRQRAHQQGFELGERDGLKSADESIESRARALAEKTARETLATTLPAMKAAAEALVLERDHWLQEWEVTAVRLAAAIADKVIGHSLAHKPDLAREMIRTALQLAAGAPQIKLRLHPEDAALLGRHAEEVVRAMASCGSAEIVADAGLSRGSCVIDTRQGVIDARIDVLLERIAAELLEQRD